MANLDTSPKSARIRRILMTLIKSELGTRSIPKVLPIAKATVDVARAGQVNVNSPYFEVSEDIVKKGLKYAQETYLDLETVKKLVALHPTARHKFQWLTIEWRLEFKRRELKWPDEWS